MSKETKIVDTQKHKGGRPPKDKEDCLTNRWNIGFSDVEQKIVDMKAAKTGKRPQHYIHDAALSASVKSHINDEQCMQVRNLAKMGNNLNQIAHRANQGQLPSIAVLAEQTVGRVSMLVQRILRGGDLTVAQ